MSMVEEAEAAAGAAAGAAPGGVVSPSANDPPLPPQVAAVLLPSGERKANALRQLVAAEDGGNVSSDWLSVGFLCRLTKPFPHNNKYREP